MSGNKFSKIIKIALISILAIIVVSVIIAIINSSHSTFKTATNSKVDIETNNSIANNKEKEYYDFIDTNVKGLHPRLESSSEYGFSMSIEVEK